MAPREPLRSRVPRPRRPRSGSAGERALSQCQKEYRDAATWRRRCDRELGSLRLTFTQWQTLQTMRELIAETKDAVTQSEVAARSGVDPMTVSDVMKKLERLNLVDRGPSASGPAYQIWLKTNGERLAAEGAERVEAVSVAWLEERARKG